MNRYELKDCNCILAFSGGADCVATLQWLLLKGKRPYIFYYEQKSNHNPRYTDAIKKIKEWYEVPVVTWSVDVGSKDNGFADRERTRDWIQKTTKDRYNTQFNENKEGTEINPTTNLANY